MNEQLPVMEHFYTLQGEGYYQGQAAYFIRLGGCDVGCTWCDVKESWDASKHPMYSIDEIVQFVKDSKASLAVITGGEPTMHSLVVLTEALNKNDIRTNIETSGTNTLSGSWNWICFSPKRFKKPLEEYYEKSHELKVVINHVNDLRWAQAHADKMNPTSKLYLQPEWDNREIVTDALIEYIKEHPRWQLSLQTHKYLNIP
jgi:7-carboxy-7-deazaguanine synthase